jgi:hypothetical protein
LTAPVRAPTRFAQVAQARATAGKPKGAVPFFSWAQRIPEPKLGRLSFEDYPFQVELYSDGADHPDTCVKKATQVGISAYLLRWVLYWPDQRGLTGLYVFPRRKQMYDFADARVDAAIRRSEYLAARVGNPGADMKGVDNKGLKRVGTGWVYFRGSESEDDLDSVDADVLCMDEYDRLKAANIPVAERRVSGEHSLGLIRRVGVPSVPNFGIDKKFQESDQRRWMVKCRCGDEQPLSWQDNVDQERGLRVCRRCKAELTPARVAEGRWAPEKPGAARRGYHMSKLVVPRLNVLQLVERSRRNAPEERQAFWNRDLAEAYAPDEGRLSPEAVAAAMSVGERNGARGESGRELGYRGLHTVTMGVDVASVRDLNVRISEHFDPAGNRRRSLFIGTVQSFDDLSDLMDRFGVSMCAVDHLPEGRLARSFAERFAGRVYLVAQTGGQQAKSIVTHEDRRLAVVRRVEAIDATFEAVRRQRNQLPGDPPPGYVQQLGNLIRLVERGDDGRVVVKYVSVGPDDFAFAEMYDLVAAELWRMRLAVNELQREVVTDISDHMEFERSAIHDEGISYREGPLGTDYSEGPGGSVHPGDGLSHDADGEWDW